MVSHHITSRGGREGIGAGAAGAVERHLYMEIARTPLRHAAQEHARGVAGLAAEIGVSRAALRRFLAGAELSAEHWEKIGP